MKTSLSLIVVAGLTSCAPTTQAPQITTTRSHQVAASPGDRWVKVRANPPTWYPRGTSTDCATGFRDGEWIYTEDSQGTRLFIPLKGLAADRRKELLAEALAARSPEKVSKITTEEANYRAGLKVGAASLIVLPVVEGAWAAGTWWDYWKGRYDGNGQPDPRTIPSSKNPTPWLPRTTN
jgi:hypothetical protein